MMPAEAKAPAADSGARLTHWNDAWFDRAALRHGGTELDYRALHEAVRLAEAGLQRMELRPDDIVAFKAAREPACIALMLAILRRGGACLPLDPNHPAARLQNMLEDARPRLLIAPRRERDHWPAGVPWCAREDLDSGPVSELSAVSADLAYVLFTSGSTGRPKGVAMRRAAFSALIEWHAGHPRLGTPARTLQFAPLGFDVAFQEIFSTFATGGSLILPDENERRDPYALLALLVRERIERLFVPYVALQAIAEAAAVGAEVPAHLRDVITAGEQLRITPAIRALFAALPGCVLHNQYGPTETHVVTAHELTGDPAAWPDLPPIGRPLPHVRVRVVDGLSNPAGADEGELWLGGRCLAAGYINRPELTAERFVERDGERWYRTGDRVRFDDRGELHFLGRVDAQIKVGGYRIEPGEIEAVLARHPTVSEVAVVASGTGAERRLVAHIVPADAQASEAELTAHWRSHCKAHLADYLVPQEFAVHAALPLTVSGKIDRRALEGHATQTPLHWPESAPLEEQLRSLWQQLLEVGQLDLHANVFDHGARSLTVIRALNELRRRGFRQIGAAQIYEHPNVAAMAALLRGGMENADTAADAQARARHQRAALARFAPRPGRA